MILSFCLKLKFLVIDQISPSMRPTNGPILAKIVTFYFFVVGSDFTIVKGEGGPQPEDG